MVWWENLEFRCKNISLDYNPAQKQVLISDFKKVSPKAKQE